MFLPIQLVRDNITQGALGGIYADHPLDVYVVPAPSDAGLAVGGVWAVQPQQNSTSTAIPGLAPVL